MCWGEDGADKRCTDVRNATVELANTCLHDNKLDDDTALGPFERDPCFACGKVASPCQLCSSCLLYAHDDCTDLRSVTVVMTAPRCGITMLGQGRIKHLGGAAD